MGDDKILIHPTAQESPEAAIREAQERLAELREECSDVYAIVLVGSAEQLPSMYWSSIRLPEMTMCEARIAAQVHERIVEEYGEGEGDAEG